MIAEFLSTLSVIQISVLMYLVVYLLVYGVPYHLLALYEYISGRGISNDALGIILNWLGYISIFMCLYWFV